MKKKISPIVWIAIALGTFFLIVVLALAGAGFFVVGKQFKSAERTIKVRGGAEAKVPAWVPEYPGSTPEGAFAAQTEEGNSGSYTFKTRDSVAAVAKAYEEGFRSMGLKTTSTLANTDGTTGGGIVSAQADKRSAVVIMGSEEGKTAVSVTFKAKR